jgi:hypothetical protein
MEPRNRERLRTRVSCSTCRSSPSGLPVSPPLKGPQHLSIAPLWGPSHGPLWDIPHPNSSSYEGKRKIGWHILRGALCRSWRPSIDSGEIRLLQKEGGYGGQSRTTFMAFWVFSQLIIDVSLSSKEVFKFSQAWDFSSTSFILSTMHRKYNHLSEFSCSVTNNPGIYTQIIVKNIFLNEWKLTGDDCFEINKLCLLEQF